MGITENYASVKKFNLPFAGDAGLYFFRSDSFGATLNKDVWVDGDCVDETALNTFYYEEVMGDAECKISTEPVPPPNDLLQMAEKITLFSNILKCLYS
jgi:hypothetical protein